MTPCLIHIAVFLKKPDQPLSFLANTPFLQKQVAYELPLRIAMRGEGFQEFSRLTTEV
jgi:hypothetical protein